MKYILDDYGNKYPALDKDETLASIGAGGVRECVLTGCVTYNNEEINFNYTGSLPEEANIVKLLACGIDPESNKLTEAEIEGYLSMNNFSIHFYYVDNEIYVTNANRDYVAFTKIGVGTYLVYPRTTEIGYYIKSNQVSYKNKVLKIGDLTADFTSEALIAEDVSVSTSGASITLDDSIANVKKTYEISVSTDGARCSFRLLHSGSGQTATYMLPSTYTNTERRTSIITAKTDSTTNKLSVNIVRHNEVPSENVDTVSNAEGTILYIYEIIE